MRIIFNDLIEKDEETYSKMFNVSKSQIEIDKKSVIITLFDAEQVPQTEIFRLGKTDNLHTIARKFNIPEGTILKNNEGIIFGSGVAVVIPKVEKKRYTVRPLDTFSSIAVQFNSTVEKIKHENNIDYIYAGQIIFI